MAQCEVFAMSCFKFGKFYVWCEGFNVIGQVTKKCYHLLNVHNEHMP